MSFSAKIWSRLKSGRLIFLVSIVSISQITFLLLNKTLSVWIGSNGSSSQHGANGTITIISTGVWKLNTLNFNTGVGPFFILCLQNVIVLLIMFFVKIYQHSRDVNPIPKSNIGDTNIGDPSSNGNDISDNGNDISNKEGNLINCEPIFPPPIDPCNNSIRCALPDVNGRLLSENQQSHIYSTNPKIEGMFRFSDEGHVVDGPAYINKSAYFNKNAYINKNFLVLVSSVAQVIGLWSAFHGFKYGSIAFYLSIRSTIPLQTVLIEGIYEKMFTVEVNERRLQSKESTKRCLRRKKSGLKWSYSGLVRNSGLILTVIGCCLYTHSLFSQKISGEEELKKKQHQYKVVLFFFLLNSVISAFGTLVDRVLTKSPNISFRDTIPGKEKNSCRYSGIQSHRHISCTKNQDSFPLDNHHVESQNLKVNFDMVSGMERQPFFLNQSFLLNQKRTMVCLPFFVALFLVYETSFISVLRSSIMTFSHLINAMISTRITNSIGVMITSSTLPDRQFNSLSNSYNLGSRILFHTYEPATLYSNGPYSAVESYSAVATYPAVESGFVKVHIDEATASSHKGDAMVSSHKGEAMVSSHKDEAMVSSHMNGSIVHVPSALHMLFDPASQFSENTGSNDSLANTGSDPLINTTPIKMQITGNATEPHHASEVRTLNATTNGTNVSFIFLILMSSLALFFQGTFNLHLQSKISAASFQILSVCSQVLAVLLHGVVMNATGYKATIPAKVMNPYSNNEFIPPESESTQQSESLQQYISYGICVLGILFYSLGTARK